MKSKIALQSLVLASLSSIALPSIAAQAEPLYTETQHTFFAQIAAHCGQAFAGKVVSGDTADSAFNGNTIPH